MIACLLVPGFPLRAALRSRPALALEPAALAPPPGTEPLLGPVTVAAEAAGVKPGMRMGEALAMCPSLVLVEEDPSAAEQAWEEIVRRLEDSGFSVETAEPGCAYFETRGVERLYRGLENALRRALAAANVARAGQVLVVSDKEVGEFLAPLPLSLLPLDERRQLELRELGVKRLGELAGLPKAAVAERLGPDGRRAWSLARGGAAGRGVGGGPPPPGFWGVEVPP